MMKIVDIFSNLSLHVLETIPFSDSMLNPNLILEKGIDSLLMGMISTRNKVQFFPSF